MKSPTLPTSNPEWLDCNKELPIPHDLYWITDGHDIALAKFIPGKMHWKFEWHYSVFVPKYFLKVNLPKIG